MARRQKAARLNEVVFYRSPRTLANPLFLMRSADGMLSVMDVRGKKSEPLARSEDQEDELLSIVAIRKHVPSFSVVLDVRMLTLRVSQRDKSDRRYSIGNSIDIQP